VCDQGSLDLCLQDYKFLCTAVAIHASLVEPKLDFVHFDLCDFEKYVSKFGDRRSVTCTDNTHGSIFYYDIKSSRCMMRVTCAIRVCQ